MREILHSGAPVLHQVGWFNTTVNGYEGTRVTVPNRRILDGTVIDKTNKRFRVCQKKIATRRNPGLYWGCELAVRRRAASHVSLSRAAGTRQLAARCLDPLIPSLLVFIQFCPGV